MSTAELVDQLKQLSNPERLALIEVAIRLIREELTAQAPRAGEEDPILAVAGCLSGSPLSASEIEEELYGKEHP